MVVVAPDLLAQVQQEAVDLSRNLEFDRPDEDAA